MKRLALVMLGLVAVLAVLGPGRPPPGSAAAPPAIAGGGGHTCALLSDGGAECWGVNDHGKLGDGTTMERHIPVNALDFPTQTPPANDDFANSAGIGAVPFATNLSTTDATSQVNEPQPCALIGSTVWYSYTPSESGTLQAETTGSDYDTALAVYTGTDLGSLSSVACDDDSGPGLTALITFAAVGGTTYHFQVGGFAGSKGILYFSLAPPAPTPTSTATPTATPTATSTPTITPTSCPPEVCTPTPTSTHTFTPTPTPTGGLTPNPQIDKTVNGEQGPIAVTLGDSVTYRWVVTNAGADWIFSAHVVDDTHDALDADCWGLGPGWTCEHSAEVTLLTPGPITNVSEVEACAGVSAGCNRASDYVKVYVVTPAPAATLTPTPTATPGAPVGGIAELPVPAGASAEDAGAGTEGSGWSFGSVAALAGGLAVAVLAFTAGAWYARRRWLRHRA